jgi:hypothetical protein
MTPLDKFSQNYLRLALEINKHIDGYVDTYTTGYDLIAEAANGGNKKPIFLRLLIDGVLPSQIKNL